MLGWFKKSPPPLGPDYSRVDSVEKAKALARDGQLVVLQLLPAAFGGTDTPHNVVYVPPFVLDLKQGIDDNTITPLAQQGKVTKYAAAPKYQGRSFVPISITISATQPGSCTATLNIWGDALKGSNLGAT